MKSKEAVVVIIGVVMTEVVISDIKRDNGPLDKELGVLSGGVETVVVISKSVAEIGAV